MIVRDQAHLSHMRYRLKLDGQKVGFTSGVFDVLHRGHFQSLKIAKAHCDVLIVALNTDRTVRSLKGNGRPVIACQYRMNIMNELSCVDVVTCFDEFTPSHIIRILQPDVYVKGDEYEPGGKVMPEREVVEAYGGRIIYVKHEHDISTTKIIEEKKKNEDA
jgi:D-beta-D-heptose 7-phosphate kinase/D-beta-D-heptose 1-phosphate adenosyltransferase